MSCASRRGSRYDSAAFTEERGGSVAANPGPAMTAWYESGRLLRTRFVAMRRVANKQAVFQWRAYSWPIHPGSLCCPVRHVFAKLSKIGRHRLRVQPAR